MKTITITLYSIFFCTIIGIGQDLSLRLNIINSELNKIEPLFYDLELSNDSDILKEMDYPWSVIYAPSLEFYNKEANKWEKLKYSDFISNYRFSFWKNGIPPKEKLYLKPNEKIRNSLVYLGVEGGYLSSNYIFENKESLIIRAVFKPNEESSEIIYSNIDTIFFTNYSGQDSLALNYLEDLSLPHFLYEKLVCNDYTEEYKSQITFNIDMAINKLIKKFPESKFTFWGYINLVWANLIQLEYNKKIKLETRKEMVLESEIFLEKILETNDTIRKTYVKKMFSWLIGHKFNLGLYGDNSLQYFKELEYIDSL